MPLSFGNDALREMGLFGLPGNVASAASVAIYTGVESLVGFRIAERLSEAQLAEFERLMSEGDESGTLAWLNAEAPDYATQVRAAYHEVCKNVAARAPLLNILLGG